MHIKTVSLKKSTLLSESYTFLQMNTCMAIPSHIHICTDICSMLLINFRGILVNSYNPHQTRFFLSEMVNITDQKKEYESH